MHGGFSGRLKRNRGVGFQPGCRAALSKSPCSFLLTAYQSTYCGFTLKICIALDPFTSINMRGNQICDCGGGGHIQPSHQWKSARRSFAQPFRQRGTCLSAYGFPFQSPLSPCKYQNTVIQSDPIANFPETIGG